MGYLERTRDLHVFVGEEGKEVASACVVGVETELQYRTTYPHVWSFVPGP